MMLLESVSTMDFIGTKLADFLTYTGFANVEWANIIMIAVGAFFIWLAIAKDFEPLLLIPIGLGIILGNIPFKDAGLEIGLYEDHSVLNIFYQGVRQGWYPPLVFLGIGAMTDFSALIANPKLMLIGAAAQFGIFGAYIVALALGFEPNQAAGIAIIGGADGPDNVTVNSGDSTGIHYPANQGLYEVTPTDEIQSKYDNEEFIIQKLHYKAKDGTWACENHTYKYRLEISGRLNNADKNTTYIVLSNSKDITFEQTWKASGLSSLMSDYFDPKDAVIVGHRLFSATSTKGNLEKAILSVLNEKYNKAGKPDGLIHIENYYLYQLVSHYR